jgi:hypothetical protein
MDAVFTMYFYISRLLTLTLLDANRRYSTLLDATRRYSTLLDAIFLFVCFHAARRARGLILFITVTLYYGTHFKQRFVQ